MKLFFKILFPILFFLWSDLIYPQNEIGVQLKEGFINIEKPIFKFNKYCFQLISYNENDMPRPKTMFLNKIDLSETAFNCSDLALFCRLELKVEKAAKIPVKFRIGEVQYVERMEGKY